MTRGDSPHWARSSAARALIAALLVTTIVLSAALLFVNLTRSADRGGDTLTDQETQAQLVDAAKRIVATARLQGASGGFTFMSCQNQYDPPYQGAVYLNFDVPASIHFIPYFDDIAAAMVHAGWTEGPAPSHRVFGKTLSKDGVTSTFYREGDDSTHGVMKIYGQCRNQSDHRNDTGAWTDITDQLR